MTDLLSPLSPRAVAERLEKGHAILVDIREPDEFARRHVSGALSMPLSQLGAVPISCAPGTDVIFTCRTGMRTGANAARLVAAAGKRAHVLAGGVDAWVAAGLPNTGDTAFGSRNRRAAGDVHRGAGRRAADPRRRPGAGDGGAAVFRTRECVSRYWKYQFQG